MRMKGNEFMKWLSVDRMEGSYVICEDEEKKIFAIEKSEAPDEVAEGDVLCITDEGKLIIDREETRKRKKKTLSREKKLWED